MPVFRMEAAVFVVTWVTTSTGRQMMHSVMSSVPASSAKTVVVSFTIMYTWSVIPTLMDSTVRERDAKPGAGVTLVRSVLAVVVFREQLSNARLAQKWSPEQANGDLIPSALQAWLSWGLLLLKC